MWLSACVYSSVYVSPCFRVALPVETLPRHRAPSLARPLSPHVAVARNTMQPSWAHRRRLSTGRTNNDADCRTETCRRVESLGTSRGFRHCCRYRGAQVLSRRQPCADASEARQLLEPVEHAPHVDATSAQCRGTASVERGRVWRVFGFDGHLVFRHASGFRAAKTWNKRR